ncbi:MAG: A/G-specific adenine glycosylase [Firmicutes bacterium]|nr:A/G-specific adenine glycosylase [Bacillota bacterium]
MCNESEGKILFPDLIAFRRSLIDWGQEHFRSFPWRLNRDPYRILVAEIMLHRTRASQVVPVYKKFINRYPDVKSLASATKNELHEVLFPLGLRWRVNLIHEMASSLVERFGGRVPEGREDLLSLPGISDYITGAVRCFAWNYPEPLADTNTVRIIGRLFGLRVSDSSRRNRHFRKLLAVLVDPDEAAAYNYALLDLANEVCTQKQLPKCSQCPVSVWCAYVAGA